MTEIERADLIQCVTERLAVGFAHGDRVRRYYDNGWKSMIQNGYVQHVNIAHGTLLVDFGLVNGNLTLCLPHELQHAPLA